MLKLRWASRCSLCAHELAAGTRAGWDVETRLVTCTECLGGAARSLQEPSPAGSGSDAPPVAVPFARGQAGASAQREYRRRRGNREARVRERHPYIGGLLLALGGSPRHERAFERGRLGEQATARWLERRLADEPAVLLHDRRMPEGRGNIDHLAVAPRGVYVIDTKAIRGKVRVKPATAGHGAKLQVNGRTRSKLVFGLARQVRAVREELDRHGHPDVPLTGVFCFTEADFPLFGRMQIDGYLLRHRRALAKELAGEGPTSSEAIDALARGLREWFPCA